MRSLRQRSHCDRMQIQCTEQAEKVQIEMRMARPGLTRNCTKRKAEIAPYAQIATMRSWHENDGLGPCCGRAWVPELSMHSDRVCRNRMSESGARNLGMLVSGGSSLASAFSFMARSSRRRPFSPSHHSCSRTLGRLRRLLDPTHPRH